MDKMSRTLIIMIIAVTIALVGFAEGVEQCQPPDNLLFYMKGETASFSNDARYIVFRQNETVKFSTSLRSAGTYTWNFGDWEYDTASSPTHSFAMPGESIVKLAASKKCGGTSSVVSNATATVHIYDSELANIGVCKEFTTIPNNILKRYKGHNLMSIVILLRQDRMEREEVKTLVEQSINDFRNAKKIKDADARKDEIGRIIDRLASRATYSGGDHDENIYKKDEAAHFSALKKELENINNLQKSGSEHGKSSEDDVDILKDLIVALETRVMTMCDKDVAAAEKRLRSTGNQLARNINAQVVEREGSTPNYEKNKTSIEQEISDDRALLKDVSGVTTITYNDLFRTYDDYHPYFYKFYLGYEYASTVNDLIKKGVPRVGLAVQSRFFEKDRRDDEYGWGIYGLHTTFQALVTGSAEQNTIISTSTNTALTSSPTPTVKNTADNKALEGNVDVFLPVYRTERLNGKKLWAYMGPVVSFGIKKVDNVTDAAGTIVDRYDRRAYAGIMMAFNPELYTELVWGKTSGLQSDRMEIRGQLPVYQFNNESRLILGAIANVGVRHRKPDESDVVRVFLTWNVNFENVYEYFTGNKMKPTQ